METTHDHDNTRPSTDDDPARFPHVRLIVTLDTLDSTESGCIPNPDDMAAAIARRLKSAPLAVEAVFEGLEEGSDNVIEWAVMEVRGVTMMTEVAAWR